MKSIATVLVLSRAEAKLIGTGLRCVFAAFLTWQKCLVAPCTDPRATYNQEGFDRGEFDGGSMDVLRAALLKVDAVRETSKKVPMTAFELAACMLGARVAQLQVRHGHIKSWRPDHKTATDQLLAKLEKCRKQAKRGFITAHGQPAFTEASSRWKQFLRWVHVYLLFCACNQRKYPGLGRIRRLRRQEQMQHWMPYLVKMLPICGLAVPPEEELRRLIRGALRSARRLGRRRREKGLPLETEDIRLHIWHFVSRRCEQGPDRWSLLRKAIGY